MTFPIDINRFIKLDLSLDKRLSNKDYDGLTKNIELVRDAIVATTAFARAKGIGAVSYTHLTLPTILLV